MSNEIPRWPMGILLAIGAALIALGRRLAP